MKMGMGSVSVREENSNTSTSAKSGVKVTMLPGPAKGKTGQKNSGMDKTFKGGRGR